MNIRPWHPSSSTSLADHDGIGRAAAARNLAPARLGLVQRNQILERQNRQLRASVRRLSRMVNVDWLTGLANRRFLELMLTTEIRRAARSATPLTLALCDIDLFKRFNDRFGHLFGDAILRDVARTLRIHCRRAGDLAARYGGEEFGLLLPGLDSSETLTVVDQIRCAVALRSGQIAGIAEPITISIGVTTFCGSSPVAFYDVIRAADVALYRAKEAGRNRTEYEPLTRRATSKVSQLART